MGITTAVLEFRTVTDLFAVHKEKLPNGHLLVWITYEFDTGVSVESIKYDLVPVYDRSLHIFGDFSAETAERYLKTDDHCLCDSDHFDLVDQRDSLERMIRRAFRNFTREDFFQLLRTLLH